MGYERSDLMAGEPLVPKKGKTVDPELPTGLLHQLDRDLLACEVLATVRDQA